MYYSICVTTYWKVSFIIGISFILFFMINAYFPYFRLDNLFIEKVSWHLTNLIKPIAPSHLSRWEGTSYKVKGPQEIIENNKWIQQELKRMKYYETLKRLFSYSKNMKNPYVFGDSTILRSP